MAHSVSFSFSGDGDRGRLSSGWGHYAPQLLSVSIVAVIALACQPYAFGSAAVLAAGLLLVFVLLTWARMREHDRRLCEHCVRSMPLNAAEAAARYQRRFWLAHSGSRPRYLIPYLVVLIGSNFLTTTTAGRIGWAVIQSSMIYLILAYSSHRTLQPWCPWCSDGGGGSEVEDPTPGLPRPDGRLLV